MHAAVARQQIMRARCSFTGGKRERTQSRDRERKRDGPDRSRLEQLQQLVAEAILKFV